MSVISADKIALLINRFEIIRAQLTDGYIDRELYVSLSREYAELEPIIKKIQEVEGLQKGKEELEQLATDMTVDRDVRQLAREELSDMEAQLSRSSHELKLLFLPRDEADKRGVILEVRAGTGGDEAALFAGDLFRMYRRYADIRGWKVDVLSVNESELGGYREIIAEIKGNAVYERLKYESGAHRVQRIPETEASGRVHTSAVTVVILPEAEEIDVEILDKDLRIDVYRASGAGGQHVNKTDSAVRITHIPTGIVVAVQDERSQHKNKARAMQILRTRMYDIKRTKAEQERAADRKSQVGSGDRSQRIRTYNFPQSRVTDHRVNLTLYKLEKIMEGDCLDELFDVLAAEDQASQLTALGG